MPLSEFDLIRQYFSGLAVGENVLLGGGDDCALLQVGAGRSLAVSVDTQVENVHFPADSFPEDIGFRSVAVAVSDLAAMGAAPIGMTLALTLPAVDELWLRAFSEGIAAAAHAFSLPLVGGDTTRGPLTVSIQVMGTVPEGGGLTRSGARPGDTVFVSGPLGDGAAGLALLSGEWRPGDEYIDYLTQRFYRPVPPLQLGQSLCAVAHAAIDVSDGLLADLGHVAAASGVRIEIDPDSVPLSEAVAQHPDSEQRLRWALAGGDDYQLCYFGPADMAHDSGVPIGRVVDGAGVACGRYSGATGFDHFA